MQKNVRQDIAKEIDKLKTKKAKEYAGFLQSGGEQGDMVPCWGAIAERFEKDFKKNSERENIWHVILEKGDTRVLLLFLKQNLDRQDVMAKVVEDIHLAPLLVQRVLASLDEVRDLVEKKLDEMAPAARQLWMAEPDARKRERQLFESRTGKLMAFSYFHREEHGSTGDSK